MNPETAQVAIIREGDGVTVTGGGSLTLTEPEYPEFRDAIKAASREAESLTVDLREAFFIDTAIVQDLARSAVTMLERGKRLTVLIDKAAYPFRVVRISGFHEIMDIDTGPWDK